MTDTSNPTPASDMGGFEISIPNQRFWTITPFRFDLPEGWRARQTVEELAYMERADRTTTNCSIRWKRVPAKMEMKVIAQAHRSQLERIDPDVKVGFNRVGLINGKMAYAEVSEFTMPVGSGEEAEAASPTKKGQYYVAFFGPRLGVEQPIELFEMIGNFDSTDVTDLDELQNIVSSFQFNLAPIAVVDDVDHARTAKGA